MRVAQRLRLLGVERLRRRLRLEARAARPARRSSALASASWSRACWARTSALVTASPRSRRRCWIWASWPAHARSSAATPSPACAVSAELGLQDRRRAPPTAACASTSTRLEPRRRAGRAPRRGRAGRAGARSRPARCCALLRGALGDALLGGELALELRAAHAPRRPARARCGARRSASAARRSPPAPRRARARPRARARSASSRVASAAATRLGGRLDRRERAVLGTRGQLRLGDRARRAGCARPARAPRRRAATRRSSRAAPSQASPSRVTATPAKSGPQRARGRRRPRRRRAGAARAQSSRRAAHEARQLACARLGRPAAPCSRPAARRSAAGRRARGRRRSPSPCEQRLAASRRSGTSAAPQARARARRRRRARSPARPRARRTARARRSGAPAWVRRNWFADASSAPTRAASRRACLGAALGGAQRAARELAGLRRRPRPAARRSRGALQQLRGARRRARRARRRALRARARAPRARSAVELRDLGLERLDALAAGLVGRVGRGLRLEQRELGASRRSMRSASVSAVSRVRSSRSSIRSAAALRALDAARDRLAPLGALGERLLGQLAARGDLGELLLGGVAGLARRERQLPAALASSARRARTSSRASSHCASSVWRSRRSCSSAASAWRFSGRSRERASRSTSSARSRFSCVRSSLSCARRRRLRCLPSPAASSISSRRSLGLEVTIDSTRPCETTECISLPRPVSDRTSSTSTSRQRAPLRRYSPSPLRSSRRRIEISPIGRSIEPSELSSTISTSAEERACTPCPPPKITSCIDWPRTASGDCSPIAHSTASVTFDLPEPLGPTTTDTPGVKSSRVRSGNDLKPLSVIDLRCTSAAPRARRRSVVCAQPSGFSSSSSARCAASCSAAFFERPEPLPTRLALRPTPRTSKVRSCGGPSSAVTS